MMDLKNKKPKDLLKLLGQRKQIRKRINDLILIILYLFRTFTNKLILYQTTKANPSSTISKHFHL